MESCFKAAEEAIGTLDHPNSLSLGKEQLQTAVLLEHSHAHLCAYCLWLLLCLTMQSSSCNINCMAHKT